MAISPTTARARQAYARRGEILDAALRIFSRRGVEATNLDHVAGELGITRGLIHHYFRTKQDLFHALLERGDLISAIGELAEKAGEADAASGLHDVGLASLELMHTNRDFVRFLIVQSEMDKAEAEVILAQVMDVWTAGLAGLFARGMERGEFIEHDPYVAGWEYANFLLAIFIERELFGRRDPRLEVDRVLEHYVTKTVRGLSTRKRLGMRSRPAGTGRRIRDGKG
ncbi:MAG: TetR family transcriptional regulator [Actinomycetota bacterium]